MYNIIQTLIPIPPHTMKHANLLTALASGVIAFAATTSIAMVLPAQVDPSSAFPWLMDTQWSASPNAMSAASDAPNDVACTATVNSAYSGCTVTLGDNTFDVSPTDPGTDAYSAIPDADTCQTFCDGKADCVTIPKKPYSGCTVTMNGQTSDYSASDMTESNCHEFCATVAGNQPQENTNPTDVVKPTAPMPGNDASLPGDAQTSDNQPNTQNNDTASPPASAAANSAMCDQNNLNAALAGLKKAAMAIVAIQASCGDPGANPDAALVTQ